MAFIIILFGKGGLEYSLCMRSGRIMIETSGLNPARELNSGEELGNKERMTGIHIDIDV